MKTNGRERELGKALEYRIGEMAGMYGTPEGVLSEEAEMDRRLSDMRLNDSVASHVDAVLRLEKLCEYFFDVLHKDVGYEMRVKVSRKGIETTDTCKEEAKVA
jgi:hypothetical protein